MQVKMPSIPQLRERALELAKEYGVGGNADAPGWEFSPQVDAFRHAYSNAVLTMAWTDLFIAKFDLSKEEAKIYANAWVKLLGVGFELQNDRNYRMDDAGRIIGAVDANMDLWNNDVGLRIGLSADNEAEIITRVLTAIERGELIVDANEPGRPGGPRIHNALIDLSFQTLTRISVGISVAIDESTLIVDETTAKATALANQIVSVFQNSDIVAWTLQAGMRGLELIIVNNTGEERSVTLFDRHRLTDIAAALGFVDVEAFKEANLLNAVLYQTDSALGEVLVYREGDVVTLPNGSQVGLTEVFVQVQFSNLLDTNETTGNTLDALCTRMECIYLPSGVSLIASGEYTAPSDAPRAFILPALEDAGLVNIFIANFEHPEGRIVMDGVIIEGTVVPTPHESIFDNAQVYTLTQNDQTFYIVAKFDPDTGTTVLSIVNETSRGYLVKDFMQEFAQQSVAIAGLPDTQLVILTYSQPGAFGIEGIPLGQNRHENWSLVRGVISPLWFQPSAPRYLTADIGGIIITVLFFARIGHKVLPSTNSPVKP